jgi:cyclic pyranopterin phosphate synthase
MQDRFGRSIRYLRLSLTSACAMRCTYCRPQGWSCPDRRAELCLEEIAVVVKHLVTHHGVRKVRLTGGEPTNRADIIETVQAVSALGALDDLAMTTNALNLERLAMPLAQAGLKRVNISLDSVDPRRFEQITGVDGFDRVKSGLAAARRSGRAPHKHHTRVVRGQNDDELGALLLFAAGHGCPIRFIELMPMGPLAAQWKQRYVAQAQMQASLRNVVRLWTVQPRDSGSAQVYDVELADGRTAEVGFIGAMHELPVLRSMRPDPHRERGRTVSMSAGSTGWQPVAGPSACHRRRRTGPPPGASVGREAR